MHARTHADVMRENGVSCIAKKSLRSEAAGQEGATRREDGLGVS